MRGASILLILPSLIALASCGKPVAADPICQFEVTADSSEIRRTFKTVGEAHGLRFSHRKHGTGTGVAFDMFGLDGGGTEVLARDGMERGRFLVSVYSNKNGIGLASALCSTRALQGR